MAPARSSASTPSPKWAKVLVALDALDQELGAHPTHDLLGSGSLHASFIEGGEEISMVPAHCKLLVERRTIPGESAKSAEAEAQALLDDIAVTDSDFKAQVKATFSRGPYGIAADHALVQTLKRHAEACLRSEVSIIGSSWWMDAALFGDHEVPTVVLGPAGGGAHARVEWVDLASVQKCQEIYTALIADFCR